MIILAVHSSSPHLGVAIAEEHRVLKETILPPGREHLENLAAMIESATRELGIGMKSIDGFGVAVGPGSFSGIRIGMATVKGMALALNKPVVGIPSLEVLAWQALQDGERGAAVIDARRGEMYIQAYEREDSSLRALNQPALIPAAEIGPYCRGISDRPVLCGDPSAEHLSPKDSHAIRWITVIPSPAACAERVLERLRHGASDSVHSLVPLYIRRSDAEEKRSALFQPLTNHPSQSS